MTLLEYCKSFVQDHFIEQALIQNNCIGKGYEGEVYALPDNKVLKISFTVFPIKTQVYEYLIKNPANHYASVFYFKYMGVFNEHHLYLSVLERLNPLSEDEKKVFHSIMCHEDRNAKKNFSIKKVSQMLDSLSKALDFPKEEVMLFYKRVTQDNIIHQNDIHVRNIMKSSKNYKLVDFDRSILLK
jgi:hypothetical protein